MSDSARESILNKIRTALAQPTPMPFPDRTDDASPFQPLQQNIADEFAEQFMRLGGKFTACANEEELATQLGALFQQNGWEKIYCAEPRCVKSIPEAIVTEDIVACHATVTSCEALVARTGSVVLSAHTGGRVPSVYAPVHICIAYASQLVYDVKDALERISQKYNGTLPSLLTFATGPSRTADIEKTLIIGVHGPKEVYCFLVDDLRQSS